MGQDSVPISGASSDVGSPRTMCSARSVGSIDSEVMQVGHPPLSHPGGGVAAGDCNAIVESLRIWGSRAFQTVVARLHLPVCYVRI